MTSSQLGWSILPYVMIAASSWIVYKLFIKPFLSPLRKIPGRTYKPIIGNMFEALQGEAMTSTINWMKELNSRLIRFYFMYGEERLLTADPDIIKYICVTNSKNYRHSLNTGIIKTLTPNFLLLMNGEPHHSLKVLLNPAFNTHAVNGFVAAFDKITQRVVAQWKELVKSGVGQECEVPAQEFMAYIALDAICECGFDYSMGSVADPHSAGVQYMRKILEGFRLRLMDMIPLINLLPSAEKREREKAFAFFRNTIWTVIKDKRHKMETGQDYHSSDLLSRLMAAKDESGKSLSDDLIFSQVGGFLFGGFETTSIGLTWTLLMLAQHPDVQVKARQEVMSLLPQRQPITAELVKDMTYLTCVVKESLRLYPPLTNHFRQAISDDVIQGYTIPAGTIIGISSGPLHRLPENWTDPDSFKPERFLEPYNTYSFLPFSAGPYMCVGHTFAMTEMTVVLARLLVHFDLRLPHGYTYRRIRLLTMQPYPPMKLVVREL